MDMLLIGNTSCDMRIPNNFHASLVVHHHLSNMMGQLINRTLGNHCRSDPVQVQSTRARGPANLHPTVQLETPAFKPIAKARFATRGAHLRPLALFVHPKCGNHPASQEAQLLLDPIVGHSCIASWPPQT